MNRIVYTIITLMMVVCNLNLRGQVGHGEISINHKYIRPGTGQMLHGDPVVQGEVQGSFGHGLTGHVWMNQGLLDSNTNRGDAMRMGLSWSGNAPLRLRQAVGRDLQVKVGLAYLDEKKLVEGTTKVATPTNEPEVSEMDTEDPQNARGYAYYAPHHNGPRFIDGDMWLIEASCDTPTKNGGIVGFHARHYQPHGSGVDGGEVVGYHGEKTVTHLLPLRSELVLGGEINWTSGFGLDSGIILCPTAEVKCGFGRNVVWSVMKVAGFIPAVEMSDQRGAQAVFGTAVRVEF